MNAFAHKIQESNSRNDIPSRKTFKVIVIIVKLFYARYVVVLFRLIAWEVAYAFRPPIFATLSFKVDSLFWLIGLFILLCFTYTIGGEVIGMGTQQAKGGGACMDAMTRGER